MFYFVCKAVPSPKDAIHNTTFPHSETKRRSEKRLALSRPIIFTVIQLPHKELLFLETSKQTKDKQRRAILQNIAANVTLLLLVTAAKSPCVPMLKG